MKGPLLLLLSLVCLNTSAQNLPLADIKRIIYSLSIDSTEAVLRRNNYKYEKVGEWEGDPALEYNREGTVFNGFDRVLVIKKKNKIASINEFIHLSNSDKFFNKYKQQSDTITGLTKIDEFITETKTHRIYCDGLLEYHYIVINDKDYRRVYLVWVRMHLCGF